MRQIKRIIIHCSATPAQMDIGVDEIRSWHVKDNGWRDIGYHYVIRRSGIIEDGRPESLPGAHTSGYNGDSLGICLVGGGSDTGEPDSNFTGKQFTALELLLRRLKIQYGSATIHGHREFSNKACPSFDVQEWLTGCIV